MNSKQETFTPDNNAVLTLYYADWCGASQSFLPVWEESKDKLGVKTETIECEKSKEKCSKIEYFPTIILTKNNKDIIMTSKYQRTLDGMKKFISDN